MLHFVEFLYNLTKCLSRNRFVPHQLFLPCSHYFLLSLEKPCFHFQNTYTYLCFCSCLENAFSSFFPLAADAFSFFIFIDLISRLKLASFSTWYSSLLGVFNTYCYLMRVGYPECAAIYLVCIICFLNTFSSSLNFFDNILSISLQLPLHIQERTCFNQTYSPQLCSRDWITLNWHSNVLPWTPPHPPSEHAQDSIF